MSPQKVFLVAAIWVASLIGATVWAQTDSRPQAPALALGPIITGDNIGFQRLAGPPSRDGKIVGKFMVKIDGQWYETSPAMRVVR
jgi:hypothetical protein